MNPSETRASLRLLYKVARADGTISADEERALEAAAETLGVALVRPDAIDVEAEAMQIRSDEAKAATLEAAIALSAVDGRCTPEEHAVLEQLKRALGVSLELPLAEPEARWLERMKEPRRQMAAAEVEFLHRIATRQGGLPAAEYRALVDDLHRARLAVLRDVLSSAFEEATPGIDAHAGA